MRMSARSKTNAGFLCENSMIVYILNTNYICISSELYTCIPFYAGFKHKNKLYLFTSKDKNLSSSIIIKR